MRRRYARGLSREKRQTAELRHLIANYLHENATRLTDFALWERETGPQTLQTGEGNGREMRFHWGPRINASKSTQVATTKSAVPNPARETRPLRVPSTRQ